MKGTKKMKYLCIAIIVALVSVATVNASEQGAHLFVLSGQSNMTRLNPNTSFTPTVKAAFGKDNVIVVKDAMGAQPIRRWYKKWKPAEGDGPKATGDLYDRLMSKVNAAIKGKKIATVTFVWMQGECDAKEKHGTVYAASLKGLVKQLAGDLKRDDINVVIGRINDCSMDNKSYPHWTKVREAQVKVAESLPNAVWVDTDDLNDPKNKVHATREGYKTLGERFAKKGIELIEKGQVAAPAIRPEKPNATPASQPEADAALRRKSGYRGLENPKPGLPKVLLVGDSICSGYKGRVRELLADKANVYVWQTGANIGRGNMEDMQRVVLAAEDFDVVHFNIGLHGLGNRIPKEKYEPLLRKYVSNYKKYAGGSLLIWGSITPVWENETGKLKPNNAKIVKRNAIAERVMKENGIPVTRLYAAVIDKLDLGGGIHWSAKGYAIMAEAITKNIEAALKKPRKKIAKPTAPVQKAASSGMANDSNIPVTARPVAKGRGQQNHHKSLNKRVKQGNVDIIFVGDSITHFWASAKRGGPVWEKYYAKRNAVNLGISGDRTQHVLWRLQNGNLEGISPKVAVVMIGTNNSGSDSSEDIAAGVKAIVDTIEEKCPSTRILILGIFPRGKDDANRHRIVNMKANKIISTFADNRTIFYLDISDAFLDENRILSRDIMPDLLHLNTKGYEIWAKAIEEKLEELMQDKTRKSAHSLNHRLLQLRPLRHHEAHPEKEETKMKPLDDCILLNIFRHSV